MFSKLHFVKCAKCYLHRDNRSMYKSTMMFWYSSLNDSFNCQGEVPQQLTISCLLVSTWQSCRGSESSHFCRLQAHRWCLRLPEWGRGGWRYPHYDQGWCGQKRGSFYCKQGELLVQKVPFFVCLFLRFYTKLMSSAYVCFHFPAVVYFSWKVLGSEGLWEDSQWS